MKILLDTQAFLWLTSDAPELSVRAKKTFLDNKNEFFLSLVSIWEIAIKISINKLALVQPLEKFVPDQLQENDIKQLDIKFRHLTRITSLSFHHRDPFDRLLIAQAFEEKMPILSCDSFFDFYSVERIW